MNMTLPARNRRNLLEAPTCGPQVRCLLAVIGMCLLGHAACAESRTLRRECAEHDINAVAWFEAQAARGTVPPPILAEAAFRIMAARNACAHGRVADAIEGYAGAQGFGDPTRSASEAKPVD
jgi:hypothetical protein